MRTRQPRERLSYKERAERDARVQHYLNVQRMRRVYDAALRADWYTMPLDFLADAIREGRYSLVQNADLGPQAPGMVVVPDDGTYLLAGVDQDKQTVHLRKVASAR